MIELCDWTERKPLGETLLLKHTAVRLLFLFLVSYSAQPQHFSLHMWSTVQPPIPPSLPQSSETCMRCWKGKAPVMYRSPRCSSCGLSDGGVKEERDVSTPTVLSSRKHTQLTAPVPERRPLWGLGERTGSSLRCCCCCYVDTLRSSQGSSVHMGVMWLELCVGGVGKDVSVKAWVKHWSWLIWENYVDSFCSVELFCDSVESVKLTQLM